MSEALLDLYLQRRRIRAEVSMGRFTRVSDLFSSPPGEFLEGRNRMSAIQRASGEVTEDVASKVVVRLSEICLVHPIIEPPAPASPPERRERLPQSVVLEIGDWQVTGTVFLVDRISWVDYMAAVRSRFLAVRDAAVRFGDLAGSAQYDFILVNGARIGALYAVG